MVHGWAIMYFVSARALLRYFSVEPGGRGEKADWNAKPEVFVRN